MFPQNYSTESSKLSNKLMSQQSSNQTSLETSLSFSCRLEIKTILFFQGTKTLNANLQTTTQVSATAAMTTTTSSGPPVSTTVRDVSLLSLAVSAHSRVRIPPGLTLFSFPAFLCKNHYSVVLDASRNLISTTYEVKGRSNKSSV